MTQILGKAGKMKITVNALRGVGLALALMVFSPVAQAQFVAGGSVPTTISADDASYQGNVTILSGGVDVRQGDVRILADKMYIYTAKGGSLSNNDKSKIVAKGHFYYLTPDQSVRGDEGIYTRDNDTFMVSGNVIMKQKDGNIITGDRLYYNLTSGNARVVGTCKGRKCGAKGRVNILIKNTKSGSANPDTGKS